MRIRDNKRHLVVNKEYSRLPYWTDDGYEDVQKSVSQKYVQDTYGAFAESENQLPYLSDADYQGLEYQYQNPEFFNPTDLPDVDFTGTAPKGTCYELWDSLFGHLTGAFIPTDSEWNSLREYAKKCPLIYMPHICCKNVKISGPSSLMPGEEAYYNVSGTDAGCAYDMKASGGEFVGNKYFAPQTPGTYELYITPWMSDDQGKKCASMSVTVEGGCHGKIGYTTLQMSISGMQTLTVTGGSEADDYSWSTTYGSLSPTTGTSVTFTAPATNPNCANNPTISLTCGGNVVDTVQIAINATSGESHYKYIETQVGIYSAVSGGYFIGILAPSGYKCGTVAVMNCNGTLSRGPFPYCSVSGIKPSCAEAFLDAERLLFLEFGTGSYTCWLAGTRLGGSCDGRTPAQIAAGCCPADLL